MQAADAIPPQLRGAQTFRFRLGGSRAACLRLLDQRADDVGLAAVVEVSLQPRVGLGAPILGDPGRDHRLALRRRQRELADIEVAVHSECERARDRRRRQVQDVRAAAFDERAPLRDAEAMLLVHDGDGEVVEVDLRLDQRVRADDDLGVSGRDHLPRGRVLLRPQRARQQADPDAERRAELVDGEEVLLGERLRRCHQRALASELDRAQQRVEGDDRLARADLPLQQPLHRRRPARDRRRSRRSTAPGRG